MKAKRIFLTISIILLAATAGLLFAGAEELQATATPPATFPDWWKAHAAVIFMGLALLVDMILDRTKTKEKLGHTAIGNVILKLFALLGKYLGQKAYMAVNPIAAGKKAARDKAAKEEKLHNAAKAANLAPKLLIAALLLSGGAIASAQSFKGILKPVTNQALESGNMKSDGAPGKGVWTPRIAASVVAVEYRLSAETNQMKPNAISRVGIGLSYAHYVETSTNPFNNYAVNAFLFMPTQDREKVALGLTGTIMRYFTAGILYNLDSSQGAKYNFGILTGVTITF